MEALLEKRRGCFPNEGNNTEGIARLVWGNNAFENVLDGARLKDSVRATLTRALNNLYKKGLVVKAKPNT